MKLKTYQAWTMAEALAFVKKDLGADAVILHTRTYDRGGFFGFGRKTVVEITAARAADMPEPAAVGAGSRSNQEGSVSTYSSSYSSSYSSRNPASAAGRSAARSSTPLAAADSVRVGAAARAYGAASGGLSSAAGATGAKPGLAVLHGPDARDAGVASVRASGASDAGGNLDMNAEREKTRRLAAALAIQLEKQATERNAASRNEDATREQRARDMASAAAAAAQRSAQSAAAPASQTGSTTAQRFVLVPESSPRGAGSGLVAIAAASVRHPERGESPTAATTTATTAATTAAISAATSTTHAPVEIPSAPAPASVDATRARHERESLLGPARVEAAFVREPRAVEQSTAARAESRASEPAPRIVEVAARAEVSPRGTGELDAISAFVGRVLEGRNLEGRNLEVRPQQPIDPVRKDAPASGFKSQRVASAPVAADRPHGAAMSPSLESAYARLIEQEVAEHLAHRVLSEVERELQSARDAGAEPGESAVREVVERRLAALLPADDLDAYRILPGRHGARRIAFVGPTGVGKTTTLAKVAAQLRLKRNLRVGIVAADTYRIAAVDQLRTYAEILGLPIEVAASPSDAARACERLGEVDVILIDTAGRSQNDRMKLSELRAFLASAAPDETHLVLSATAAARTLAREAEAFGALGVDRIALTKLDEAASFGTLVSLVEKLGTRVSFLTHGQEVPDHIELGRSRRLAALVMGSEVR